MEIVFWLGRFYLDGRPSEFTDMGGCPALTAAEHLCSSGGTRDAVSSTAFHSGGVAIVLSTLPAWILTCAAARVGCVLSTVSEQNRCGPCSKSDAISAQS